VISATNSERGEATFLARIPFLADLILDR
jgi:hypothetical protein